MTTTHYPTPIPLILLAAGGSTRMGAPKQLMTYGGRSLLRHAAETALASVCCPVIIVLGAHADTLRSELNDLDVTIIENPHWQEGMSSSLKAGVTAVLGEKTEGRREEKKMEDGRWKMEVEIQNLKSKIHSSLLVMLCDQPFVTPELLNTLVRTGQETGKLIVACAYGGSVGVPALFDRTLFKELLGLEGATGAKQILAKYAQNVVSVPFAEGDIDVDTPADYVRVTAQVRAEVKQTS